MHKLFLGLGVLVGSLIFVPNVGAISSDVMIYQLQTGVANDASSEYVVAKNFGADDVDVTDWCIVYSSSSDATQTNLKCLTPSNSQTKLLLSSGGYATFASSNFVASHSVFVPTGVFSAGIAASGGHIKILDSNKNVVDKLGWGTAANPETVAKTAHSLGYILERSQTDSDNNANDFSQAVLMSLPGSDVYEETIQIDVCPNTPEMDVAVPVGYIKDTDGNCYFDMCDNLSGLQKSLPIGFYQDSIDCYAVSIKINEILPNVGGSDTGKEYVEFYNPTPNDTNLVGYFLQVGPSFSKNYYLPDIELKSGQYTSLSDTQLGLTLSNTSGSLRLFSVYNDQIDETNTYENPPDDHAWALFADAWRYTNTPTPGEENEESVVVEPGKGAGDGDDTQFGACPTGKYRNPATNRCKNIETEGGLKPCAPDQIRNSETNRCRSVFATTAGLTACKPGQIRNPETNRCRKSSTSSSSLKPCAPNQERNPETNRCRKKPTLSSNTAVEEFQEDERTEGGGWLLAGGATIGLAGYGVSEWRTEIFGGLRKLYALLGKNPPTD